MSADNIFLSVTPAEIVSEVVSSGTPDQMGGPESYGFMEPPKNADASSILEDGVR